MTKEKSQHQQLFFRDMLWRFCPRPRFVVSDIVIGTGRTGACLGCTQSHSCGVGAVRAATPRRRGNNFSRTQSVPAIDCLHFPENSNSQIKEKEKKKEKKKKNLFFRVPQKMVGCRVFIVYSYSAEWDVSPTPCLRESNLHTRQHCWEAKLFQQTAVR